MKIRIDHITAEARELSFAEPETEINRILAAGPIREYRLEGPIAVSMSIYRAGFDLFLSGDLRAPAMAVCARCAEEFAAPGGRPFKLVMSPKAAGADTNSELRIDDLEFSLYAGDEIDLSPLVREQILLALPTRPLCREDCRGLCPHCGVNLNRAECGCRAENHDPRWTALLSLKLRRT
ncbi:MAG: YceD family protein [Candidatus Binataceae bacterium]